MIKELTKCAFLVGLSIGIAASAFGQARGFAAPARAFSAPARSFSSPARSSSGSIHGFAGRQRGFNGFNGTTPGILRPGFFVPPLVGTPLNPNFAPIRGVPGLGFDFQHLAAIEQPFRGRFGGFGRGRFGFLTPLFFGGLPLYYPYDSEYPYETEPDDYAQAAQQPMFVIPQPQPSPAPTEPAPRPEAATPQAPPPELGQLILVRNDGQVVLAVAFTVRGGQLTYITNEGTRRTFPFSELDKQATRQMNDANGTTVSLPN